MKQKAITISISFGILLGSTFLLSLIFALLFHFGFFFTKKHEAYITDSRLFMLSWCRIGNRYQNKPQTFPLCIIGGGCFTHYLTADQ